MPPIAPTHVLHPNTLPASPPPAAERTIIPPKIYIIKKKNLLVSHDPAPTAFPSHSFSELLSHRQAAGPRRTSGTRDSHAPNRSEASSAPRPFLPEKVSFTERRRRASGTLASLWPIEIVYFELALSTLQGASRFSSASRQRTGYRLPMSAPGAIPSSRKERKARR